jgi:hypothetical protein
MINKLLEKFKWQKHGQELIIKKIRYKYSGAGCTSEIFYCLVQYYRRSHPLTGIEKEKCVVLRESNILDVVKN